MGHTAEADIEQIEEAYLVAILGAAPGSAMVGKASERQFRCFVEDMLQVLAMAFGRDEEFSDKPLTLTRRDRLRIVCQLILNAAPSSSDAERRRKRVQGIALWRALFQAAGPVFEAMEPECIGLRWPAAVRNRFHAALHQEARIRWPHPAFSGQQLCLRIKYQSLGPFRLDLTV